MFLTLGLILSQQAEAGGVGMYTQAGIHQGNAYYYTYDGDQGIDTQFLPHYGVGFEGILGDKDDRLHGIFRLAWNQDQPVQAPSTPDGEEYYFADESTKGVRNDGLISIGLQWGIWGEPTEFQVIATTLLTSGFWTPDSLEYFVLDLGVGATFSMGETLQLFGVASFSPRYRKELFMGSQATFGARVLFD
ncbi:MAG: hypothetical protein VX278_16050 [Myxococcota bacterium]|nr:hypothetical protein [Myxococcota bacterium]